MHRLAWSFLLVFTVAAPCLESHAAEWIRWRDRYILEVVPGREGFLGTGCGGPILAWNGLLFLRGDDGVHGCEMYVLGDLDEDPVMLADLAPGPGSSTFQNAVPCGDLVYFTANVGALTYRKLFATDGTPEGTYLVADINPGADAKMEHFACIEERLFFSADDGIHGRELWVSDGTSGGTRMLADIHSDGDSIPTWFTPFGDMIVFSADSSETGWEIWRLTEDLESATLLVDVLPGPGHGSPHNFTPFKDGLVFTANIDDPVAGLTPELFFTDGTAAGTRVIKVINDSHGPYVYGSGPSNFTVLGDVVVFAATTNLLGTEPWRTDGTEEGTYLLRDIDPRPYNLIEGGSGPRNFWRFGDYVFFTARDGDNNRGLWYTDGTVEGTALFPGVPAVQGALPNSFREMHGFLYFNSAAGPSRMHRSYHVEVLDYLGASGRWHRGLLMTSVLDNRDTGGELGAINIGPWVVSLEPETESPTDAQEAAFLAVFSEPVMGVDAWDFEIISEGLWAPAVLDAQPVGDGTVWRVTVDTGLGDGALFLRLVDNGSISDTWHLRWAHQANPPAPMPLDGYGTSDGSFTSTSGLEIDKPAPTVRLETAAGEPTGLELIPVTASFSHAVTGFTPEDIVVANAAIANFAGSGADYTFDLVPGADGLIALIVPANVAMDAGGLGNAPSNELRITYGLALRRHSADTDGDYRIRLTELLRVVQFFNFPGYRCDPSNVEDGYAPGLAAGAPQAQCAPHDSDYAPRDWLINLTELLRLIQFFNVGGYHYCEDAGGEGDGFCTGPAV